MSDEFWYVFPRLFLPYKCRILHGWNNHFSLIASRLVNMIELDPINSSKAFTSFPATPSAAAQATGGFLPGSLKRKTVLCSSETGYLGGRVCEFDVYLVHQMANHCKCLLQLDDQRNPYMNNGCFTKHPWKNCCLGYQVLYIIRWCYKISSKSSYICIRLVQYWYTTCNCPSFCNVGMAFLGGRHRNVKLICF